MGLCYVCFPLSSHHGGPRGFLCVQEWNLQTYRCQLSQTVTVPQTCNTLCQDNRVSPSIVELLISNGSKRNEFLAT